MHVWVMSHIGYESHKENSILQKVKERKYIRIGSYLGFDFTKIKFSIIAYANN